MKLNALILSMYCIVPLAQAEDWPRFRGPRGGNYVGPKLPTEWGTDKNVAWKTTIPGKGWSSPIVWKGKIYLTTAVPKGANVALEALCIDAKDGSIAWEKEVFVASSPRTHSKNSHASATPVTDGEYLFVHFGHLGTAALDFDGKIVWTNANLQYKPVHGNGGSPIVSGDSIVFSVDGGDQQFVVALNKKTGEIAWKTDRKSKSKQTFSFSTPLLLTEGGREQIVSPASGFVASYDSKTGKELWRATYPVPGYSVIPQPVFGNGLVYLSTGYNTPLVLAVKPDGNGEVTTTNIAWSQKKGAPHTPSPLLVGEELYSLSDTGFLTCMNAKTGEIHWSERLTTGCSASPIAANGKIYVTSEAGNGIVVAASKEFKEISRSELKEKTYATFAAVDGALYVRTETKLYRFGNK